MPERLTSFLLAIFLFLTNGYVCRELFRIEYLPNMGSIEGAYIGISRYAMAHWRDLTWFPLWYNGVPYQNTYPPLLHWGVALAAWMGGITPAHAYHWTTALAYCLGPVTVFALVRGLCGSAWPGFIAGLLYSAVSPSAFLIPAIAGDMSGRFHPRRLQDLAYYGEGPHVAAMTLLPLAIWLVDLAVRKRRGFYFAAGSMALAAVVLTNWLAGFALGLGVAAYILARIGRGRDLLVVMAMGACAYGLAMPWAPPSTIAVTQWNAQTVGGDYTSVYRTLPVWLAGIAAAAGLLKLAARRCAPALQFALFLGFFTTLLTLSEAWWHHPIVPQAGRYHLEMEMALVMLAGIAAYEASSRLTRRVNAGGLILFVLLLILPLRAYRHYARTALLWNIDITRTAEWKTADWLNRNWSGERVLLPGSTMFWLLAFSDVPQLGGGFDQGIIDPVLRFAGNSLPWLKALGVQGVWRDGETTVDRVGKPHASLARVIPESSLVKRTPRNAEDIEPLREYVAALDDPAMPEARLTWASAHSARIEASLEEGQVISWQIAWHPGWRANAGGLDIPVARDGLGLMTIRPPPGQRVTGLTYDGGREMRVAKWISAIACVVLLALAGRGILKKSW
jgi:hypothetical protein